MRDWIEGVKAAGELKIIKGAETKEEIGGFVDIYMRKMGNPAVMFDEVPGFPKGHRVLANILTSVPRINIALGLPPETTEIELTQWWRKYFKNAPSHPTKAVNGGPLLDNVLSGADVNIEKIPTPVWHELDGGPFIGTACLVVMKDPDSGWVNYGTYRVQSHDPNDRERDDVARQARPDHHAEVSRARPEVPGGGGRRHASVDGHARRHRDSLRQERA